MRESFDVKRVADQPLDLGQLIGRNDNVEIQADDWLDVRIHGLSADQAELDVPCPEQSKELLKKI